MPTLPQELIDEIVYLLCDDRTSIRSCSLSASCFQHSSREVLFRDTEVACHKGIDRIQKFSDFLLSEPPIVTFIRRLSLIGGRVYPKPTMAISTLSKILNSLPNIHSLSLGLLSLCSGGIDTSFRSINLHQLSLDFIDVQCSDIDSYHKHFLNLFSLFRKVEIFVVESTHLEAFTDEDILTYEATRQWIDEAKKKDPTLVERFQVSSLSIVDTRSISSTFFLELIRNTSVPHSLSLHVSAMHNASAAQALIAHTKTSLISLAIYIETECIDDDNEWEIQLALPNYTFDLCRCENLVNLRLGFGIDFPVVIAGMHRSIKSVAESSTAFSLRNVTLQAMLDKDTAPARDEEENFKALEKVTVDLSELRLKVVDCFLLMVQICTSRLQTMQQTIVRFRHVHSYLRSRCLITILGQ
ncbi:hypothetical protein ABKN59_011175 [Abortiporus biennis]